MPRGDRRARRAPQRGARRQPADQRRVPRRVGQRSLKHRLRSHAADRVRAWRPRRASASAAGSRSSGTASAWSAALPGNQGRLLFAYLVLHRDRPVRRDELLEVLWSGRGGAAERRRRSCPPRSRACARRSGRSGCSGRGELSLALPARRLGRLGSGVHRPAARRTPRSPPSAGRARGSRRRAALEIADGGLLPGLEARWIDEKRAELADLRVELLEVDRDQRRAARRARAAARRAGRPRGGRGGAVPRVRARGADRGAAGARQRRRRPAGVRGRAHAAARGARRDARPAAASRCTSSCCAPSRARGRLAPPALPDRLAAALATPLVGRREPLARLQAELARAPATGETAGRARDRARAGSARRG